jgi:hypothetical protein
MKHTLIVGFISICFMILNANARELDIDLYGLSYHIDGDKAYPYSPRRLDNKGQTVYNPGLGISYDFRKNITEEGFAPMLTVAYFQDCFDEPFYYGGGGVRYRNYIDYTSFMWEVNIVGLGVNAFNSMTGLRKTFYIPAGNVGIGYKFSKKYLIKANFAYVPGTSTSAISSTDLIFMQISLGF